MEQALVPAVQMVKLRIQRVLLLLALVMQLVLENLLVDVNTIQHGHLREVVGMVLLEAIPLQLDGHAITLVHHHQKVVPHHIYVQRKQEVAQHINVVKIYLNKN